MGQRGGNARRSRRAAHVGVERVAAKERRASVAAVRLERPHAREVIDALPSEPEVLGGIGRGHPVFGAYLGARPPAETCLESWRQALCQHVERVVVERVEQGSGEGVCPPQDSRVLPICAQRVAHDARHEPGVRVREMTPQLVEAVLKAP